MANLFSSELGSDRYLRIRNADDEGNVAYRQWLEYMWSRCMPHFPGDFLSCFQSDTGKLDASIWELILSTRFLEHGIKIKNAASSNAPDQTVILSEKELRFECALPSRGADNYPDAVPPRSADGNVHMIETDKNILRCTSTIQAKIVQHQRWLKAGICNPGDPFVIALHGRNLDLNVHNESLPDIARAVYPIGSKTLIFNKKDGSSETGRAPQTHITKSNGEEVDTCFFANESCAQVSGLLYSVDWGPFLASSAPLYTYLPNPFATNPLPLEILAFSQICHSSVDPNGMITISLDPKEMS